MRAMIFRADGMPKATLPITAFQSQRRSIVRDDDASPSVKESSRKAWLVQRVLFYIATPILNSLHAYILYCCPARPIRRHDAFCRRRLTAGPRHIFNAVLVSDSRRATLPILLRRFQAGFCAPVR